ncbi:MAG: ABC transporter substrate-binding protein [Verrucomicrobiae bacterium]|nr:ABC transporter substrate-binding protein [Verrucomicrobiae bacterium]
MALAGGVCGAEAGADNHVVYTDKMGEKVCAHAPVQRAVMLHLYEFLPALGCWDQVAGVSRYAHSCGLLLAAHPGLRNIPAVGSGMDVNIEGLLKLKPDVVVTWVVRPDNIKFMRQKGLKVIAVYPDSLGELYELIELQGRLFGREREARNVRRRMEAVFDMARERTARLSAGQRQKVLWLGGRPNTVSGAAGLTHEIFGLIGGNNAAGGIGGRSSDVSMETIVGWNPDVVFIWGNAKYSAADILGSPQWQSVKAAREKRVYKAPEWGTWSPRLALVALWMGAKIYPELYKNIDLRKTADDFYRNMFGVPFDKETMDAF